MGKKFSLPAPKAKPSTPILTFDQALTKAGDGKKHLLTGNGFSMAWDHKRFSYQALFDRAGSAISPEAKAVFKALATSDFEVVMRMFRDAARLVEAYRGSRYPKLAAKLKEEADAIRDALATAVAASHPERPSDIPDEAYSACRTFLANFKDVYTLNYDLLLYWALMQSDLEPAVSSDDGFRTPDDGPEEYVTWEVEKTDSQSIFYLHGALHVFDAGHEIQKYTWCNTGIRLIEQVRAALDTGKFPVFVSEGTWQEKMARIQHSNFLGRAYRSFAKIRGPLFIYGHSLAENDEHILRLIEHGKMGPIFISIYGDLANPTNQAIIRRGLKIATRRDGGVDVHFYDAASAKIWGK